MKLPKIIKQVDAVVTLEFPLGEIARGDATSALMALLGPPETGPLTGKEGFNAQGLEGKAWLRLPLWQALGILRKLSAHRGRIVT